ncbi:MAG: ATP-binding protein [Candidatus Magasanikbacteria bacterium]|nr:ATP-binding protein [Candidatus Magasanikbacteria bacterium]
MKFSIKTKVVSLITLSILIVGSISIYFVFTKINISLQKENIEQLKVLSLTEASEIENTISNIHKVSTSISENKEIVQYMNSEEREVQREDIRKILNHYNIKSFYYATAILDLDGEVIVSTDEIFLGKNYSFRDYFQKAIKGERYTDIALGATSKQFGYYFSNPIKKPDGTILGVVLIKARPSTIESTLYEVKATMEDKMIVDNNGIILYSTHKNRTLASLGKLTEEQFESEKTKRFPNLEKKELDYDVVQKEIKNTKIQKIFDLYDEKDEEHEYLTITKINNSPLFLVFELEQGEFSSSFASLAKDISIIGLLTLIIIALLISLILSASIRPLRDINEFAKRIAEGDYNVKISIKKTAGNELFEIAKNLNKMTIKIKTSRKDIERKIAEQTKKISKNSRALEIKQTALINVLEDVEDEKDRSEKFANELEKFKLATDHASDMVTISDEQGKLLYVNSATEYMTGYKKEYILDKKHNTRWFSEISQKQNIKKIVKELQKNKKPTYKEIIIKTKEDEKIVLGLKFSPILDKHKKLIFLVGIGRDITKEKEIDRSKSEFVSVASHQLRTPLSTINWYTELLLSKDTGKLNEEQEDYIQEIRKDNKQMTKLVESLLNVSKIDLGTFVVEPKTANITTIADHAIKELRLKMEKQGIKFTKKYDTSLPKRMKLDPQLTHMIFQNLLSNAIKYTERKGKISLNIKKREKDIEIIVSDSGIGIPKRDQDKIFTKLFRARNAKIKHTKGVGLGLYIIKSIIDNIDGKIWFKSQLKKGSTFYATIPLKGMRKGGGWNKKRKKKII